MEPKIICDGELITPSLFGLIIIVMMFLSRYLEEKLKVCSLIKTIGLLLFLNLKSIHFSIQIIPNKELISIDISEN